MRQEAAAAAWLAKSSRARTAAEQRMIARRASYLKRAAEAATVAAAFAEKRNAQLAYASMSTSFPSSISMFAVVTPDYTAGRYDAIGGVGEDDAQEEAAAAAAAAAANCQRRRLTLHSG